MIKRRVCETCEAYCYPTEKIWGCRVKDFKPLMDRVALPLAGFMRVTNRSKLPQGCQREFEQLMAEQLR